MSLLANSTVIKTVQANSTEMYDVYANNTLVYSKRVFTINQKYTYPSSYVTTVTLNKAPLAAVKRNSTTCISSGSSTTSFSFSGTTSSWTLCYGSASSSISWSSNSTKTVTLYAY